MVNKIFSKSKKLFTAPQVGILSAASVIMLMIVASRVLGLVRQRVLAHFFSAEDLSLFFAAFRLPDFVFEILVFGTFSAAFIPVFTKTLKKSKQKAWRVAGKIINIGLIVFVIFAGLMSFWADPLYSVFAPGFDPVQRAQIVRLARILFISQGFFVMSYVLTGALESLRRFLVPALAPLFYNLGIIIGTILLAPRFGLIGPVVGVFFGAALHFLIQLPLSRKLGFRFIPSVKIDEEVRKIGRLAFPRMLEVAFLQISKTVELFLASLISTAAYTYYTFGNTLQLLPVGLFGISIAKAALPTLTRQSDNIQKFKKTLFTALYEIAFLVLPVATILIVLRIPIVRLVYGTEIFSWESTVQTGLVVSAFAVGIVFQAAVALLSRSFYALQDTKTPVIVSVTAITMVILIDVLFIRVFSLPVWGLAAAYSIGSAFQATVLFYLINKRTNKETFLKMAFPMVKSALAAVLSGSVMFLILKVFDRSVWVKKLSFLGKIQGLENIAFQSFVLDTRYTGNLIILVAFVSLVGVVLYISLSILFKSNEVWHFFGLLKRILKRRKIPSVPQKGSEPVSPPPTDSSA